jgi:hypothetical protein
VANLNLKLFRCLAFLAAIGTGSMAFAAGLDGLEYKSERTVKLNSGKEFKVIVGMRNGEMMAIVPMEFCKDLFKRAEGHSLTVD